MKKTVLRIAFVLALLVTSAATLRAQPADVMGGTFTITLDPTLWATLDVHGITTTLGPVLGNVTHSDTILTGLYDLATGVGSFTTKGQMKMTGPNGDVITVLQLFLDTTGTVPVVTGDVYANGVFYKRQVIFTILKHSGVSPAMQLGTNNAIYATQLSPYMLSLIATSFKTTILATYHGYSFMSTSIVLVPAVGS